jgi:hypothetical protein
MISLDAAQLPVVLADVPESQGELLLIALLSPSREAFLLVHC